MIKAWFCFAYIKKKVTGYCWILKLQILSCNMWCFVLMSCFFPPHIHF